MRCLPGPMAHPLSCPTAGCSAVSQVIDQDRACWDDLRYMAGPGIANTTKEPQHKQASYCSCHAQGHMMGILASNTVAVCPGVVEGCPSSRLQSNQLSTV